MLVPEVAGGKRGHDARDCLIFEHVSGAQGGYRDVPLPVIAVHRCFSENIGGEVLRGRVRSCDDVAVRFANPDIFHFQLLGGGGIAEYQLTKLFDARLALDPNDSFGLLDSGAVVLKARTIEDVLEDGRFVGIFRLGSGRRLRLRNRSGE